MKQHRSKSPIEVDGPIKPMSTMELTLPDGRKFEEQVNATLKESSYAKDKCDVTIGSCHMEGDLKHYEIVFKGKTLSATVSMTNTVPAWRSQCGPILFGDDERYYFNWLPATPEGDVIADVTYPEGKLHLEGSGYHDHNWGNISMLKLMHHWYWGRAKIGDYKVIYEYVTPDGGDYRITYDRRGDISRQNFIDLLPGVVRLAAKLVGFEGSYLRFEGSATIERIENGTVTESATENSAVWELMYFGKSGADKT